MKVAIIDPSYLTWPYTQQLCEALIRQGCEVDLIANRFLYSDEGEPTTFRKWEHFYRQTVRLYRARTEGAMRQYVKGAEHVVDMLRLPRLLKSLKPDVIHYQQAPIPWVDRLFLPGLKRLAPLVSTVHNTVPFHGEGPWFIQKGFRSFISQFNHLIVHADHSRRQLVESLKIQGDMISVLHHPVFNQYEKHASPPDSAPSTAAVKKGEHVVLFFGNISHYKGLDILIRALKLLKEPTLSRTKLLVAGNPQISIKPLKKLAASEGVEDRIIWELGYVPDHKINSVFARASIVALPYRHIDGSGVLATALCYGKPLIASHIGSFGEIIKEGVHGCLVEPENPADLARQLAWMLSDPERLAAMSQSVRVLRSSWPSWDEMAVQTIRLYQGLKQA